MRVTTTPNFCAVCIEGLWLSLLKRVDLIDRVQIACMRDPVAGTLECTLDIGLVPIGQFRQEALGIQEGYTIEWRKDGARIDGAANQTTLVLRGHDSSGVFDVDVEFVTEEVRLDSDGLLKSHRTFIVVPSSYEN